MKRVLTILLFFIFIVLPAFANEKLENLWLRLSQAEGIIDQVKILTELGDFYDHEKFDSAYYYHNKSFDLASKHQSLSNSEQEKKELGELKIIALRNLAYIHDLHGQRSEARKYATQLINLGTEKNDSTSLLSAWLILGNSDQHRGSYPQAFESYLNAFEIAEKINDTFNLARISQNLGIVSYYMGNLNQAANYTHEALDLYASLNNLLGKASCLLLLGNLIYDLDKDKALDYYTEAYDGFNALDHIGGKYNALMNIGNILLEEEKVDEAIQNFEQALEMARQINDHQGMVRCLHNLGMSFSRKGQLRRALQLYQESLDLSRAHGFKHLEANTLSNMAGVNNELNQFGLALNQAMESLRLSQEIQSLDDQVFAYRNISKAHEGLGNFKQALDYHKYFKYFNDSIRNIENHREVSRLEAMFQNERMLQEINLKNTLIEKQELEMEQQAASLRRQRLVRNFLIFGSLVLAAFAANIYISLMRRKKKNALILNQKQQIEEINSRLLKQNEEITSQHNEIIRQKALTERNNDALIASIRYAQNIQKSLLPEEDGFFEIFKEFFLIFKPKEIVSGDFYWTGRQNGTTLLAVADSTGHGVPGAFLSLMGISFLNEYIARRKYQSPAQLLDEMRLFFISSLHQHEGKNDQKDGIEMACIAIDHHNKTLVYSGAKMPIYIASNHPVLLNQSKVKAVSGKIHKISGDKMPISFHKKMVPFKNHSIALNEDDMLYIMSDGFADQIKYDEADTTAAQSERFSSQRFLKLINEIYSLPAEQQREMILESLQNWQKDCQQVDDITVIGVRV